MKVKGTFSPKTKKRKEKVSKKRTEKDKEKEKNLQQSEKRQYFAVKSVRQKDPEDNQKILSNKASSLLKKIFKKSTKNVQKKQIMKNYEMSQRNSSCSSTNSQKNRKGNLPTYHDYTNLCDFSKYFEINFTQISKIKILVF